MASTNCNSCDITSVCTSCDRAENVPTSSDANHEPSMGVGASTGGPGGPAEPLAQPTKPLVEQLTKQIADLQQEEVSTETKGLDYIETKTLATIEVIESVTKHPNADSLWIATVQGWGVIVNLAGMFGADATPDSVVGKKVVYVQIDSIMPETFKDMSLWGYLASTYMGKRVRSAKIRGMFSQGLILDFETLAPLFPNIDFSSKPVGANVTNDLKIIKYYSIYDAEGPGYFGAYDKSKIKGRPSPASLRPFPEFLEKTDQPRLQAQIGIVRGLEPGRPFTATQKYDGQSVQWFHKDGRTGVCSRNFEVLLELDVDQDKRDKANDKFREMNDKYGIFAKLTESKRNVSVQTEMYGMGINGNRHKKNTVDIAVFDVYDIDKRRFLTHKEMVAFATEMGLPTVPVVFEDQPLLSENIEPWLKLANSQRYVGGLLAEGIVVRTSDGKNPYISFKVISQEYLVKYDL